MNHANSFYNAPLLLTAAGVAAAPGERSVSLQSLPLRTPAELLRAGEHIWSDPTFHPAGIDSHKAVVIGDFGLGTDSPILMDYRRGTNPAILRLSWNMRRPFNPQNNRWVVFADTFDAWMPMVCWDYGRFS